MRIYLVGAVALSMVLSACGARQSDSAKFTPPADFDMTKGTCNPGYTYPANDPCSNPTTTSGGIRLVVTTMNCPATIGYSRNGISNSTQASSFDKTFTASKGETFSLTAQSTCGAGGSASVKIYKNNTLLDSDSKVGPGVAKAFAAY